MRALRATIGLSHESQLEEGTVAEQAEKRARVIREQRFVTARGKREWVELHDVDLVRRGPWLRSRSRSTA
jgi:hypothetical protein